MAEELRQVADGAAAAAAETTKAAETAGEANERFERLSESAFGLANRFLGFEAAKNAVNVTASLSSTARGLSSDFGMAEQAAADWSVVARANDIEASALTSGLHELAGNAQKAGRGAGEQAKLFAQLGVSQRLLRSGDVSAIFSRTADGLRKLGPTLDRNRVGTSLLGKEWSTLRPLLGGGSRALGEQMQLARRFAPDLAKGSKASSELARAQRAQRIAMMGVQTTVGRALAPALTVLANTFTGMVASVRQGGGGWAVLRTILRGVGETIRVVSNFFAQNRTLAQSLMAAVIALRAGLLGYRAATAAAAVATRAKTVARRAWTAAARAGRATLVLARATIATMQKAMLALRGSVVVTTVARRALNMVIRANPIVRAITVLAALAGAFVLAYKRIRWFRTAIDAVWNFVKKHWATIGSILGGPIAAAVIQIVKNWRKIRRGFEDVFRGLAGVASNVFGTVRRVVAEGFNWLIDKINAAIGRVNGVSSFLSFGKLEIPTIPRISVPGAATGGVVTRPGSVLVGERGPEILRMPRGASVIPLEHPAAARTAGGGARDLHVHVNVDRRELARAIVRGVPDLEAFAA